MSGGGVEDDPYVIYTIEEYIEFAIYINTGRGGAGEYFALGADIDFGYFYDYGNFPIIGSMDFPFEGVFDGRGFAIKNIKVSSNLVLGAAHFVGIFGYIRNAVIKNLKIMDVSFMFMFDSIEGAFGLIAGYAESSLIYGCWLDNVELAIVLDSGREYGLMVGGLVNSVLLMCNATNIFVEVGSQSNADNFSYIAGYSGYTGNGLWDMDIYGCYVQVHTPSDNVDSIEQAYLNYAYADCYIVSDSSEANYTLNNFILEDLSYLFSENPLYLFISLSHITENVEICYFSASYIMDGLPMLSPFYWEGDV